MDSIASIGYVEHLSYVGVFLAMATTGYLVPLPEEIILLASGFLIASGISNAWIMLGASILGAITGDMFIYYVCHHGSRFAHKLKARIENGRFSKYIHWFRENRREAIFATRFIVGMRFISPVISGLLNIPWFTFLTYNTLAALIFVPLVTGIGYVFHNHINGLIIFVTSLRHDIVLLAIILIVGICSTLFIRAMWNRR